MISCLRKLNIVGPAVLLAVACAAGRSLQGAKDEIQDQGVFKLLLAGQQVGVEKFLIRERGDRVDAKAEVQLRVRRGGKVADYTSFPHLVLNNQLFPLTYSWSQQGTHSSRISADFRRSPARVRYHTINGRQDDREFQFPPGIVILDDNVINQYELLTMRYDRTAGGTQVFRAFIPQRALPGTVSVTSAGNEDVRFDRRNEMCRHLVVSTDLARINLWVDRRGRLLRMDWPSSQFVAIRAR